MAHKVYVSPSSQTENTYAAGNTNEAVQCRRIAVALVDALIRCGIDAMTNIDDGVTMYDRARESDAWGADLHVPVHTNAFDTLLRGTRMFCYDLRGEGYKASKAIFEELAPVVPGDSDGIRAAGYYEIVASRAPCAYVEAAFHDHPEQAAWIISHIDPIAEAICKGICKYFGVAYVSPEVEKETIYRVQIGAYKVRENAEAQLEKAKAAGFEDAFITKG